MVVLNCPLQNGGFSTFTWGSTLVFDILYKLLYHRTGVGYNESKQKQYSTSRL